MASLYCICPSGLIIITHSRSSASIRDNININNKNNNNILSYLCKIESVWKYGFIRSSHNYWISLLCHFLKKEEVRMCLSKLHLNPFHSSDRLEFRYFYFLQENSKYFFCQERRVMIIISGLTLFLSALSLENLFPLFTVL